MPASKSQVKSGVNMLSELVAQLRLTEKNILTTIQSTQNDMNLKWEHLSKENQELNEANQKLMQVNNALMSKNQESFKKLLEVAELSKMAQKASDEAVWGLVFQSAIEGSDWLKNRTFYPGRWAAGYQLLYVLFRILNDMKPISILELGLGQTTRMLSQYVNENSNVSHKIVEHDKRWIEFFTTDYPLTEKNEINFLELIHETFLDDDNVLVYKDFKETFVDKKFDMIVIDAPFGGTAKKFARIDVLKLIPDSLADSFVIVIDDANRHGELNTISHLKKMLREQEIEFEENFYRGNKNAYVIASSDNAFLCSL
jgi:hypothetical protein